MNAAKGPTLREFRKPTRGRRASRRDCNEAEGMSDGD